MKTWKHDNFKRVWRAISARSHLARGRAVSDGVAAAALLEAGTAGVALVALVLLRRRARARSRAGGRAGDAWDEGQVNDARHVIETFFRSVLRVGILFRASRVCVPSGLIQAVLLAFNSIP